MTTRIGVLALQGGFGVHGKALDRLAAEPGSDVAWTEVRRVRELDAIDALILPGGESTTLLKLMGYEPWFEALTSFRDRGGALLGTCAGAILLATRVVGPEQPSIGLLDATVERNAFGRQIDSFETELDVTGWEMPLPAVFIRAPRFLETGSGVEVLARLEGEPVLVRQGRVAAATFHPELTEDPRLHRWFAEMAASGNTTRRQSQQPSTATAPPVLAAARGSE